MIRSKEVIANALVIVAASRAERERHAERPKGGVEKLELGRSTLQIRNQQLKLDLHS